MTALANPRSGCTTLPDFETQWDAQIVRCPACSTRFRLDEGRRGRKQLTLRCRCCGEIFVHRTVPPAMRQVLVAHGEEKMRSAIAGVLKALQIPCRICTNAEELLQSLVRQIPAVVLLDVGLPGGTVHLMVEKIRHTPGTEKTGILLVASVFRPGAYYRGPVDLHGADDYLAPHRLQEDLAEKIRPFCRPFTAREEAPLEVRRLARVIATDIALHNRDRLDTAICSGKVQETFREAIADGEALLLQRLGSAAGGPSGEVWRAFRQLVEQRAGELHHP